MRRLLVFTSGFALSCLLCALLPGTAAPLWTAGGISVLLLIGLILLPGFRRILRTVLIGLLFGFLWCWLYSALLVQPARVLTGKDVPLEGEVVSYSVDKSTGTRAEVRVTDGTAEALASVFFSRNHTELQPGDRIKGSFSLQLVRDEADGDSRVYSNARGVVLTGFGELETVLRPERIPIRYLPRRAAHAIRESILKTVPEDASGFLVALLTADRSLLSAGVKNDLRTAGVSHVIAISGMHVSILLGFFILILGRGRPLTWILGIPAVLFFVFMTGATPSVTRAAVMQIILLLTFPLNREDDPPTSLSAAALLVLLWDPNSILQASFLLSFGAVGGILLVSGRIHSYLTGLRPIHAVLHWIIPLNGRVAAFLSRLVHRTVLFVTLTVSATLGALLLTSPIAAILYGSFSVYAVLSNLLILWAISVCFIGGMLIAVIGLVCQPVGAFLGGILAIPVRYILWVAHGIARLPFALLSMHEVYGIAFLAFTYLIVAAAFLLREKRLHLPLAAILIGLLTALCFVRLDLRRREFEISALDVGEGQCICVITSEFSAVYDCGGSSGYEAGQSAASRLRDRGVDRLNYLILSHYDTDHVNGVEYLMQQIPVDAVCLPDVEFAADARRGIEQAAADAGAEIIYVTEDALIEYQSGSVTIYAPVSRYSDNAASLACWFRTGDYDTFVTGDMDLISEYDLILSHALPDADLFIAGHHGAKNSSSEVLLQTIRPETVWISVGSNSYGHPAGETLDRFAAIGAAVYRTDECGDLTIGR